MRKDMRQKYPWSEWEDLLEHTIDPGAFNITAGTLQASLYARARRQGLYVWSERTPNDHVRFQFAVNPEELNKPLKDLTRANDGTIKGNAKYDDPRLPHCSICGLQLATSAQPFGVCMMREIPDDRSSQLIPKHTEET